MSPVLFGERQFLATNTPKSNATISITRLQDLYQQTMSVYTLCGVIDGKSRTEPKNVGANRESVSSVELRTVTYNPWSTCASTGLYSQSDQRIRSKIHYLCGLSTEEYGKKSIFPLDLLGHAL